MIFAFSASPIPCDMGPSCKTEPQSQYIHSETGLSSSGAGRASCFALRPHRRVRQGRAAKPPGDNGQLQERKTERD